MTDDQVRNLASQSPIRSLTTRLGELKEEADKRINDLASTLKHIDETRELLNQHGLVMTVDLGPIGNAAAHARTAQLADAQTEWFTLPREAVA